MEVERMTNGMMNQLLEAIAQLVELRTGNQEAADIIRSFKISA